MIKQINCILLIFFILSHSGIISQTDSTSKNRYCTPKIIGLSPTKLVSLSYEYAGNNTLTADTIGAYFGNSQGIKSNQGIRFSATLPVIVKPGIIFSIGLTYHDYKYQLAEPSNTVHPLNNTLANYGLRSYGISSTVFKPLNCKHFLIGQISFDFNGDFQINELPAINQLKTSAAIIYGIKKHERLQYGFGLSRAYKGGTLNYFPIILYNYTFKNTKWGIEILLPSRGNVRYSINTKNQLYAGFELDGYSYRLNNMMKNYSLPYNNLELKRSEIKLRLKYDIAIYKLLWFSLQVGYRINNGFNIDEGDNFRGFTNQKPFLAENKLTNPIYFNVGFNLVAP